MSAMVNLGIGLQEPLTRPGAKVVNVDENMSTCSSTPQDHGEYTNSCLLESDLKERKCHTLLKNMYEPKMDVILTISLKITAGIRIRKHIFCILLRRRGI